MQTINNASSLFARIQAIVPTAKVANAVHANRSKRDSIEEARAKVAEKLRANKLFVEGEITTRPDPVYKAQAGNMYAVGAKYGNRFLSSIISGSNFVTEVSSEQLPAVLDMLAQAAEEGAFDAAIGEVMQANVAAKKKA